MALHPALPEPKLEVILPVYNEARTLPILLEQLDAAATRLLGRVAVSYLFIDDGSSDGTADVLDELHRTRSDVRVVRFVRNYGHNAALACGLSSFRGDIAVFMDADLQDDPASLVSLFEAWQAGASTVVVARGDRSERAGFLFKLFYFLLRRVAKTLPAIDYGTHCLLDRSVVERLRTFQERNRYFPGLVGLASGKITAIPMSRGERLHGSSRVGFFGLVNLAVTALVSFSATPVRIVSYVGILCSVGAFLSGAAIMAVKIFTDRAIPGWASIMTVTLFTSGIQSLCLGIIGEYIARMYEEVKGRPLFMIDRVFEKPATAATSRVA